MSHSYSTRKFLNIKDKNIIFPEDYFEEVKLNGITSFVFKGILSYHFKSRILMIQNLTKPKRKILAA